MNLYQNIEKIELGIPDPDLYPNTISDSWIPIKQMKGLNKFNEIFCKNIDILSAKHLIVGWKKSRGDGNCYFRSVISSFFLIINKPLLSPVFLTNFIQLLERSDPSSLEYEYTESKNRVLQHLYFLKEQRKHEHPIKAYQHALELMKSREFDLDLIRISRLLTHNEICKRADSEEYSFLFIDGLDSVLYDVSEMNREGGDHSLIFLPLALDIQVKQFMYLDQEKFSVQLFPEYLEFGKIQIQLIRREAHYDILCSIQQMETEMVCIDEGVITIEWENDMCRDFKALEKVC